MNILLIFLLLSATTITITNQQEDFYTGCGVTKGCLGTPEGCVDTADCELALSYYGISRDFYQFAITAKTIPEETTEYVAVALSKGDNKMHDDNSMACIRDHSIVDMYWHVPAPYTENAVRLNDSSLGLSDVMVTVADGMVDCSFTRQSLVYIPEGKTKGTIDLNVQPYFVLFACGRINQTDLTILEHNLTDSSATATEHFFAEFNPFVTEVQIYVGCGDTKGCLGFPAGCLGTKNCTMMVTYSGVSESTYRFELQGYMEEYVAMTLSEDMSLGNDSTVVCTDTTVKRYWSEEEGETILLGNDVGLTPESNRKEDNYIYCSFLHESLVDIAVPGGSGEVMRIDLNADMYNVLLSRGSADINDPVEFSNVTAEKISLAEYNFFLDEDYSGCGESKGCFGLPPKCVDTRNCDVLSQYIMGEDGSVAFRLSGKVDPGKYLALALSEDGRMGEDSAMICTLTDVANFTMAWNEGQEGTNALEDPMYGVVGDPEFNYEDGKFSCSFTRQKETTVMGKIFNLKDNAYFLLLARGVAESVSVFQEHDLKLPSATKVDLGNFDAVAAAKTNPSAKVHGIFMVIAWFLFGGCGIYTARYCKKQFGGRKLMGKDAWFPLHQLSMSAAWLLSIIAFIVILAEYGVDPLAPAAVRKNGHAAVGLASFCLAFVQPFLAAFRCDPGHKHRPVFNWVHLLFGFVAMLLAVTAVILATADSFTRVTLEKGSQAVAIIYAVLFFASHLFMTGYTELYKKEGDDRVVQVGLAVYAVGAAGLTLAMIVLISIS